MSEPKMPPEWETAYAQERMLPLPEYVEQRARADREEIAALQERQAAFLRTPAGAALQRYKIACAAFWLNAANDTEDLSAARKGERDALAALQAEIEKLQTALQSIIEQANHDFSGVNPQTRIDTIKALARSALAKAEGRADG